MSHIYKAKVELKNVNPQIMRQVIQLLSKHFNMPISSKNEIYDYFGHRTTLSNEYIVLQQPLLGKARNVAINIRTGEILGDFYGTHQLLYKIRDFIKNTYIALTTLNAFQQQYYTYSRSLHIRNEKEILIELEVEV